MSLKFRSGYLADSAYNDVTLLLHGEGFVDNSPTPKTITRFGDTKISTIEKKVNNGSIFFGGNGDYLQVDGDVFNPGLGDFTIEWWQKLNTTTNNLSAVRFGAFEGIIVGSDSIRFYGGTEYNVACTAILSTNWEHVAICRLSGVIRIFHNGILKFNNLSNSNPSVSITSDRFNLGESFSIFNSLNGYIDEFRVTVDTARYSTSFAPRTERLPDSEYISGRLVLPTKLGLSNKTTIF